MAKAAFGTRTAANICAPQDDRRQGAGAGAVPGGAEVQLTWQCCCLHNPSELPPQPVELVSAGVEKSVESKEMLKSQTSWSNIWSGAGRVVGEIIFSSSSISSMFSTECTG